MPGRRAAMALACLAILPSSSARAEDGAWTPLAPTGDLPPAVSHPGSVYDPLRDRFVFQGGGSAAGRLSDAWALTLGPSPAWSRIAAAGTPPPGREMHTVVYDSARDRLLVFGGIVSGLRNDVWALTLSGMPTWSEIVPLGTPPARRYQHAAIYDPVRDRMLVFGGNPEGSGTTNDVWALDLSGTPAWTELSPAGVPPSPRFNHSAIFDPLRDRMTVYGGAFALPQDALWALELSGAPAWTRLTPAGTLPPATHMHSALYDPGRDRMLTFGGIGSGPRGDQTWELNLAGTPAWRLLSPGGPAPGKRFAHGAAFQPGADRMIVFGGMSDTFGLLDDAWVLTGVGVVGLDLPHAAAPALLALAPNPARTAVEVGFVTDRAGHVRVEIVDLTGRRVRDLCDAALPAGRHVARWDRRAARGARAPAGVYLVVLRAGGEIVSRRVALLD
jgi:hypothetical protein